MVIFAYIERGWASVCGIFTQLTSRQVESMSYGVHVGVSVNATPLSSKLTQKLECIKKILNNLKKKSTQEM